MKAQAMRALGTKSSLPRATSLSICRCAERTLAVGEGSVEVQASYELENPEAGTDAVLQWVFRLWGVSLGLAFLAGTQCCRQCGSRLCWVWARKRRGGATVLGENLFPSPPSSRVRRAHSPSSSHCRTATSSLQTTSKSSRAKQKVQQATYRSKTIGRLCRNTGEAKCHGKGKKGPERDGKHGHKSRTKPMSPLSVLS